MALIERSVKRLIKMNGKYLEVGIDKIQCDKCSEIYEHAIKFTILGRNRKLALGLDVCKDCMKKLSAENIASVGKKYLSNRTPEEKSAHGKMGGNASKESEKFNSSKFSTENWNNMTPEEQITRVTKASNALHDKLKSDPTLAAQHYAKVLSQSQLGYMSKGHKDLHNLISHLGFISHTQIGYMQVDECNEDLKIVVEYNGDLWHCNPRKWRAEEYNSSIRMTAGEKWQKDIARHRMLGSMGYKVIIVWESGWIENARKYINRIEECCNEIIKQNLYTKRNLL